MEYLKQFIFKFVLRIKRPKNEIEEVKTISSLIINNLKSHVKYHNPVPVKTIHQVIVEILFNLYDYSKYESSSFINRIRNNTSLYIIVPFSKEGDILPYFPILDYKELNDIDIRPRAELLWTIKHFDYRKYNTGNKYGVIVCDYSIGTKNPYLKRKVQTTIDLKNMFINFKRSELKFISEFNPRSGKFYRVTIY